MRPLLAIVCVVGPVACSSPKPKPAPVIYRWPERTAAPPPAAAPETPAPEPEAPAAAPADPVEAYIAANPGLSDRLRDALRARALVAGGGGMSPEEVLLVVPRGAVLSTGLREVTWQLPNGLARSGLFECWELDRYQRWQALFFADGRLRGWLSWDGSSYAFPD